MKTSKPDIEPDILVVYAVLCTLCDRPDSIYHDSLADFETLMAEHEKLEFHLQERITAYVRPLLLKIFKVLAKVHGSDSVEVTYEKWLAKMVSVIQTIYHTSIPDDNNE